MEIFELIQNMVRTDENLIRNAEELDKAIDHIIQLVQDACTLYFAGSYSSSAFLSITACEEVAKAHIGSFTNGKHPENKGRNVFQDHKTKHIMAALPTVPMGQRLEDALGKGELQRIMNMAQNAGFIQTRENALYFQREKGSLAIPSEKIDKNLARSSTLFAIEVFDDTLVGMTNYSFEMVGVTDTLFEQIKNT
ncbi:AbiV family abortive infection protein [Sulfuricurvum sp.]|uniref:AbiV family abortive infection protein n=1 Tax=Sulfuricurvum sp. TaxID=2025608 RepID=UPI00260E61BE|nr:AbiV family abortive infection protein [Sulfuricurvum sp.]MDD4950570.1 AbiV family abortive infection protein [Sulfuricurvum sp.]